MACSGVSERSEKTSTLEANTMFDLKKKAKQHFTTSNWIHANQAEQRDFVLLFFRILFSFFFSLSTLSENMFIDFVFRFKFNNM